MFVMKGTEWSARNVPTISMNHVAVVHGVTANIGRKGHAMAKQIQIVKHPTPSKPIKPDTRTPSGKPLPY